MTDSPSYTAGAKILHWLIALLIIGMLAVGWTMNSLPNGTLKFSLFQWHKSFGITVLLLSLCRLVWRLTHPAPPLPSDMPGWEKFAARATHVLFYVLIIAMPLLGWVMVSASPLGLPTILFGVIPWPHLPVIPTLENKKEVGHMAAEAHGFLAYALAGLLVLHVGAALKHHFIAKDDILTRMAPKFLTPLLNALRKSRTAALGLFFAMLLTASPAHAKSWTIDYADSRLGFAGHQGDASFEGSFKSFKADIDFDPAHPESGKITATIDITSATTGNAERDSYLPQPDWFNATKFPQATFASTTIAAKGSDKAGAKCFEATGNLTIKGISKQLTLPFCLKAEGDHFRAQGKAPLLRTDYRVGEHDWANESYVKYAVEVSVDLSAKPAP
jgi:cytochrome b561/polyisoprenoid-binding protein YceI